MSKRCSRIGICLVSCSIWIFQQCKNSSSSKTKKKEKKEQTAHLKTLYNDKIDCFLLHNLAKELQIHQNDVYSLTIHSHWPHWLTTLVKCYCFENP